MGGVDEMEVDRRQEAKGPEGAAPSGGGEALGLIVPPTTGRMYVRDVRSTFGDETERVR